MTDVPGCVTAAASSLWALLACLGLAPVPQTGEPVPDSLVALGATLGQADHPAAQDEVLHLLFGHRD